MSFWKTNYAWLYDLQALDEEPRVPRKKGQPAGSDKHSDLYTDENPKGTIKGLGFKDTETARASVSKIKNSGKTHAHKIQAAVAMEQRAKEMGKSAEAKIYRTYIDKMKEKTKEMQNEDATMLRFRDLLPKKMKHALYRMSLFLQKCLLGLSQIGTSKVAPTQNRQAAIF